MLRQLLGIVIGLSVVSVAAGTPMIDVGNLIMGENNTGQKGYITVTGGDAVQGLEFNVEIGGGVTGPIFEGVDVLNGTIFDGNNGGGFPGSYVLARAAYQGVVTSSGSVSANGLLATMSFDTSGYTYGYYTISLISTPEGRTNFAGLYTDIVEGQIILTKQGDSNGDFKVDLTDLGTLATYYGTVVSDPPPLSPWEQGDFNGDGNVDLVDLGALAGDYGWDGTGGGMASASASSELLPETNAFWYNPAPYSIGFTLSALAANYPRGGDSFVVPEPASLALLALGGLGLLRRKRGCGG